jgi:hypothetical protein
LYGNKPENDKKWLKWEAFKKQLKSKNNKSSKSKEDSDSEVDIGTNTSYAGSGFIAYQMPSITQIVESNIEDKIELL